MPARSTTQTIVFTDIESSTRLWLDHPGSAAAVIELHDQIITATFEDHGGRVIKSLGDGLLAVFPNPPAAMKATAHAQQVLYERRGELAGAASVRMAIHSGPAELRDGDVIGLEVTRCQRIMSAAHGGQILVSSAARDLVGDPPAPLGLTDLGRYRLKSLDEPEDLHQLTGPGLRRDFPPLESPTTSAHNLPAMISSFVGRVQELEVVDKLIRGSRLVTLTGEGGVGKTRLALEVASRLRGRFEDGIWLIDLEGLEPEDSVAVQVASTLDLLPTEAPTEAVVEHLANLSALVVFDNCERVTPRASRLIQEILVGSPNLRVLATSRERLAVPGEAVYRVPPMPVPDPEATPAVARRYDSVRLFAERAEMAAPGFRLTNEWMGDVVNVCRRLDGVPLAIELAAAKSGALSPDQIADGLTRRLGLLDRTDGDVGRHRSLTAAVAWSFDLLGAPEQRLFAALSVFSGGFDAASAAAMMGDDETDVWSGLASLTDKSLIRRDPATSRFRMLEPLRAFADEALARTGSRDAFRLEHARFFADVADTAYAEQIGSDLGSWLDRLDVDHGNLRSAYDWAMDAGRVDLAMRIAVGTAGLWKHRGHAGDGRRRLEAALEAGDLEDRLRARGALAAGDLAADLGDTTGARAHLETSRRLGTALGDFHTEAWSLVRLASIAHKEGDLPAATRLFEEALASGREAGDDLLLGHVLASLALLVADQGDADRARDLAVEAVQRSRATANPYAVADALLTESEISLNRGDIIAGRASASEALDRGTQEGLGDVTAWALSYLGWAAVLERDLQAGRALLEDAIERFDDVGTPMGRPWAIRHLAIGYWWAGDEAAAVATLQRGLAEAAAYVRPEAPMVLEVLGWVLADSSPETAARLLGCAETQRDSVGLTLTAFEASQREAVADLLDETLGADRAERFITDGRSLTLEEATSLGGIVATRS